MSQIVVGETEQLESALRRFKRKFSQAGILSDVKKNRHFFLTLVGSVFSWKLP